MPHGGAAVQWVLASLSRMFHSESTVVATTLSLAPGFSRVWLGRRAENRFNGFPKPVRQAAEAADD